MLEQVGRPGRPQHAQLRGERSPSRVPNGHQRRLLAATEGDRRAVPSAKQQRLGVMVPMDVGDDDATDVVGPVAERVQRRRQRGLAVGDCPSTVDQLDAAVVREGVDVHRSQAVVGERKRHPMDPRCLLRGTRAHPGVTCARGLRHDLGGRWFTWRPIWPSSPGTRRAARTRAPCRSRSSPSHRRAPHRPADPAS